MKEEYKFQTKVKCPKCKSKDLFLDEIGTWSTQYIQEEGFLFSARNNVPGEYFKVIAECQKCKHTWRLKNIIQITDLKLQDK